MTMKKLLCGTIALTLALSCTGALAETEDLQAQLDAANAKIEELQGLVDTYYPVYAAQIVATYGTDGVVWLTDAQNSFSTIEAQYSSYGISLDSYGLTDTYKKQVIDDLIQTGVIDAKAKELGLDQLSEETVAGLETSVQETLDYYNQYYIDNVYADTAAEDVTDDMKAEAAAYWETQGFNHDAVYDSLYKNAISDAVYNYVTADVTISEEEVQAAYDQLVSTQTETYADANAYISARNAGTTIAWNPEGARMVKHVLISFSDDQMTRYTDLKSTLATLNAEKDAIENPTASASAEADATDATTEASAAPQRTLEEVESDITACVNETEALYSELLPTAEEVVAAFDAGTDIDTLIAKYGSDPGMTKEPTATEGYAVIAGNTSWDTAFTESAMSIAEVGQISAPVYGSNGIHIIYYLGDVTPGAVSLDSIHDDVQAQALSDKVQTTYNDQIAAWVTEANPQYFYANFGIAE